MLASKIKLKLKKFNPEGLNFYYAGWLKICIKENSDSEFF